MEWSGVDGLALLECKGRERERAQSEMCWMSTIPSGFDLVVGIWKVSWLGWEIEDFVHKYGLGTHKHKAP